MTQAVRNMKVWMIAAVLAMAPALAAQTQQQPPPTTAPPTPQQQPPPTTPPAQQAPPIDKYVVGQAVPPEVPGSPVVTLTLEQAMQVALEKNVDLQAAKLSPLIQDYSLQAARAAFRATVSGTYRYNNSSRPTTSQTDAGFVSRLVTQGQTYNSSVSQPLPWFGASTSLSFNNSRTASNSATATRNPDFQSTMALGYTQPLLRNFKIDNTRNTIQTQLVQRQITDIQLLSTIENTKASVRTAYWALRSALEQIEISKRALVLAQRSLDDSKIRVEIGTLAPIETLQFETQVANAEVALLDAEVRWNNAELAFKRLLIGGPEDDLNKATINPIDVPRIEVQKVDIPAAVATALAQRTDIIQTRKNLEISVLQLDVTKNATLPDLGLSANYSLAGAGGNIIERRSFGDATVTAITPGGYNDALKDIFALTNPTWTLQMNFSYPLGMAAAKANLARAQLQLEQSQAVLKAQELTVTMEVTDRGLAVDNTYKQYQAAQKARQAAEKNAEAAQTRFEVGLVTNFEVVQLQNAVTQSRLTELGRLIAFVNAVAEFDRVQRVGR